MSTTNSTTPANTPAANSTTPATQTPNPAADARARLLEAIEEASFEPTAQETHADPHPQVRHQRDTWWNHIVTAFFLGDEARMFRELRISSVVFEEIVNAVADLPLQRRGRRAFIFSHRERVLFLHVFLPWFLDVSLPTSNTLNHSIVARLSLFSPCRWFVASPILPDCLDPN